MLNNTKGQRKHMKTRHADRPTKQEEYNIMPTAAKPPHPSQVPEQFCRLDSAVARLEELSSRIEKRLESVLMPCLPSPCGTPEKTARPQMVSLAESLSSINDVIDNLHTRMNDMMNRIEL
jgi:hypothetical protein